MGRVTINGSVAQFSCKRTITKEFWGVKGTELKERVRARNHVAAFIKTNCKRNDMSMIRLTPDFIKEFAVFLAADRDLLNGSI